ncbi:hypothetical protein E4U02_06925 [Microbacterium paludicola]|uniref:Uncharacterized protein n=1 Tax=Microbacterium paludicola TaxID=300019 RepID=A0A4Y9FY65_9MICO|nr:hypothetical protein [Microbacterium paludicola]MBF0816134.1 hypothetical protein [Microbacterium paludicola]TFU33195.1 hypothetical protein E4U02_06925 [Microbacterium paludicola]
MTFFSVILPLAVIATSHFVSGGDAALLPAAAILVLFAALAAAYAPSVIRAIARTILPAAAPTAPRPYAEDKALPAPIAAGTAGTARPRAPAFRFRAAR